LAEVISSEYRPAKFRDIDTETNTDQSYFLVTFRYIVGGKRFVDQYEAALEYPPGHQLEIGYDPTHPRKNSFSAPASSETSRLSILLIAALLLALLIYLKQKYGWDWE
jgi:hypothetical protein